MAFKGYLLKIEGVILPLKYISIESYSATPNQILDVEAGRNSKGTMFRTIAVNRPSKIEFETPSMHLNDMIIFKSFFVAKREKLRIEFWNDETSSYMTDDFYSPDITYKYLNVTSNDILYSPARVAFIGYANQ